MEYRKLPHGTEQISVIGLGTSVVGERSVKNVADTVTYALDQGVNYIDLAGGHAAISPGIGQALAGRRKDAYLQLHFGADYTSGEYGWNLSLEGVKKSVAWQLENLKTDYIDFGFMHCLDEAGDLRAYEKTACCNICWTSRRRAWCITSACPPTRRSLQIWFWTWASST